MKCLVIVDAQVDFVLPNGKLVVPGAIDVIPKIKEIIAKARLKEFKIVYTVDWHPEDAEEFKVWPKHCIEDSDGAQIVKDIEPQVGDILIEKNELSAWSNPITVRELAGAEEIYVTGFATNFCVTAFVNGARERGIKTFVINDAIAGVNLTPYAVDAAIKEMIDAGASFITARSAF